MEEGGDSKEFRAFGLWIWGPQHTNIRHTSGKKIGDERARAFHQWLN